MSKVCTHPKPENITCLSHTIHWCPSCGAIKAHVHNKIPYWRKPGGVGNAADETLATITRMKEEEGLYCSIEDEGDHYECSFWTLRIMEHADDEVVQWTGEAESIPEAVAEAAAKVKEALCSKCKSAPCVCDLLKGMIDECGYAAGHPTT